MIWLQLFYVYLKIGIFGFGGGYQHKKNHFLFCRLKTNF